ncbi:MAG TPA: ORF6N domain-containing protein [Niabella sp.]|nr:ORF6N domain-containing protein [Niabella sp.]
MRGQKLMLDRDLAEMYNVETRVLKQAVKRNMERFPKDFMFQMVGKEIDGMVSQNVIPSKSYFGGAAPFCFTEQGVTMLSCILNSKTAIEVNIRIIRVFTGLREYAVTNKDILLQLAQMEKELKGNSRDIENIFAVLKELIEKQSAPTPRNRIGFKQYNKGNE